MQEEKLNKKQKGITLIALIITIIVMLILVGVTVNVALNGGLFVKAEKATYQTEVSTVKEQLEIAKAVAIADNGGEELDDYSGITVANLNSIDENTKNKYKDKIFVNATGNICYNPQNVTDTKEQTWLEEIGINADNPAAEVYSFTLNELESLRLEVSSEPYLAFIASDFWNVIGKDLSQDSNYYYNVEGETVFAVETDNEFFNDFGLAYANVQEIGENCKFLISPVSFVSNGTYCVKIYVSTTTFDDVLKDTPEEGKITPQEFVNTYGDVEFRFVDISSLGLNN